MVARLYLYHVEMKRFRLNLFLLVMLFGYSLPISAFDQYESMAVGETKTFDFPSEVTNRASTMYAYNCSSDHINNVEVVSYTNTSVTVRALAYTQSQVCIRFDYWWYENNYGRHDTHNVHIDLNDTGSGGSSNENPMYYTIDKGSWGTINIEVGEPITLYSNIPSTNSEKLLSVLWSNYSELGYSIESQNWSTCIIKGSFPMTNQKLWCLWKYGNSTYKNYYIINIKESTKEDLSLSANPAGGKIDNGTKVYLTASNSSASIYYTTNGDNPTTSSTPYTSSGISIDKSCTLKAFARRSGCNDSPVMTWIYTVNDRNLIKSVSLNTSSVSLVVGETQQLAATIKPDDATDKSVTWKSSDIKVATVSDDGLVTAVGEGKAIITCTANDGSGVEASCEVTVEDEKIKIDATNFPDANFRNYLLEQDYGEDGVISGDETNSITYIDVFAININNLKGIEYFTALTYLDCSCNQLTSLDLSRNTALETLWCEDNRLTSLDVSRNTALVSLDCSSNQLTSLDLSRNTTLEALYCGYNQLASLDLSKNMALVSLDCSSNQLISLDLSKNTALETLYCKYNQLTSLDLSRNTALETLYCEYNQLASLDLSKNTALETLSCEDNRLTSLDVSRNTALTYMWCDSNQLTSLDLAKNTALVVLACYDNRLMSLDVSKNMALENLYCHQNQIRGEAMEALIKGLPRNRMYGFNQFRVISDSASEGNVCTTTQVAAAKAKGWTPMYNNGTEWVEYAGSDEVPSLPEIANIYWLNKNGQWDNKTSGTIENGYNLTLLAVTDNMDQIENCTFYYTMDGTTPTKSSAHYASSASHGDSNIFINQSCTFKVFATSDNYKDSKVITWYFTIEGTDIRDTLTYEKTKSASHIHNISGQRLTKPTKGINIINDKKVVVK